MDVLASVILQAQPREKAGARTSARFAFQVHASLAKLLELHEAGHDYRALFDHLDDLTIMVGSGEPTGLRFYQIKGREPGPWKPGNLCTASGDAPRTTIGKMYHGTGGRPIGDRRLGQAVDGEVPGERAQLLLRIGAEDQQARLVGGVVHRGVLMGLAVLDHCRHAAVHEQHLSVDEA